MAQKGLRSPLRILRRFSLYDMRRANVQQANSGIQQEEARGETRFPQQVNRRFDRRLPSR